MSGISRRSIFGVNVWQVPRPWFGCITQAGLLWPEDYLGALDEDGLLKLSEFSLITSLRHWTVFAEAGFGLRLSVNVPASLLPKIPVSALVASHRPQSEKWPGQILELTEDQIVRDLAAIR